MIKALSTVILFCVAISAANSQMPVVKNKKLKAKEDNIVVRHIYSKFGQPDAKAILHVYKDTKTKEIKRIS